MKCSQMKENMTAYLSGNLDNGEREAFDAHMASCTGCQEEVASMKSTWEKMDQIPEKEPGPALRSRFYAMLEAEKRAVAHKQAERARIQVTVWERFDGWLELFWPKKYVMQFGVAVGVLLLGLWLGGPIRSVGTNKGEMTQLRNEVQEMRQLMSLSLMNQTSSVSRIQGVSLSMQVQKPDVSLLETLFEKIESDPNVNVRLAAVDALVLFREHEVVQTRVVESLKAQDSPMVQVALIDLMMVIREHKALEALKSLIGDEHVNPDVKAYAEQKSLEIS